MTAYLRGIGVATPLGSFEQGRTVDLLTRAGLAPGRPRAIQAIADRAGIDRRHSVLLEGDSHVDLVGGSPRGTGARMCAFADAAAPLAADAADRALAKAEAEPASITHLITVSCTGFASPGVDFDLIDRLGLSPAVLRTNVGFMGCHAAVNALRTAQAFADAKPARVLVVCVELCTLHMQSSDEEGAGVANALFSDGAAAAVVSSLDRGSVRLEDSSAIVIPDTRDAMSWRIGDDGFEMTLSSSVPDEIGRAVPAWVDGWLAEHGLGRRNIAAWAIHPGGPRVLDRVRDALGLTEAATVHARAVLREHGNMSSATLLHILSRMLEPSAGGGDASLPAVALAFGPGLVGEGLLLTRDAVE